MSQNINCSSCGAANQLLEGRTSMFCSFCGSSIQTTLKNNILDIESSIKVKPEISKRKTENREKYYIDWNTNQEKMRIEEIVTDEGGKLSLINRDIKSINEVTLWFSDNELSEIKILDLSQNKLKSLAGIERFTSLSELNISNNNDLIFIDSLPNFQKSLIFLKFSNCDKLISFSDDAFEKINSHKNQFTNIFLYVSGSKNFDFTTLNKVNFKTILEKNWCSAFCIENVGNNLLSDELIEIGFKEINVTDGTLRWHFMPHEDLKPKIENNSKIGCFIATATMGSYDHPEVMELRYFRDNWILQKSWGEGFVKLYYHYGAIAAKFIEKSFVLKKISYLLVVKPLVYLARIVKI